MLSRPQLCRACVLDPLATGYVLPDGPPESDLLFLGEAAGRDEAFHGRPFVGPAGSLFNRALALAQLNRARVRVDNVVRCQPPGNELDGEGYEHQAIETCRRNYGDPNLSQWLRAGSTDRKVLMTLGGVPMRHTLGLERQGVRVQDFHGTVHRDPTDRFWIVPSYHPSHIQRGAFNLLSVLVYDIQVALDITKNGFQRDPMELVLDPDVAWFQQWIEMYMAAVRLDPEGTWLAVDIETLDKASGADEGELSSKISSKEDRSYRILRINFSCAVDQGITVPWQGPYIPLIKKLLKESLGPKIFWNAPYDCPRLMFHGCEITQPIHDAMWWWHHLQSDLPRGLGFVAPFYSNYGAWKHLARTSPVEYAAIDGPQTLRVALGVCQDLRTMGMWETCYRHVYELDTYCLRPSEEIGLLVDKEELERMDVDLTEKSNRFYDDIQKIVPQQILRLAPKDGWRKEPSLEDIEALNETRTRKDDPQLLTNIIEQDVPRMVKVCLTCQAQEVAKTHRCEDRSLVPQISVSDIHVRRYFVQEEFNPGSPQQLLSYMKFRKHKPGKDRRTKRPTTNKDTLNRLLKTKDPLYPRVLDLRAVDKVRTTYVEGSKRRLESDPRSIADGRLHPTTTHKPSTQRLSMQAPNLQNVIADRGGREGLAAGFRRCLISEPGSYLIEADFSGIEAVETGWFSGDPNYVRLAKLGVHAFVTSHLIGEPADLSWSDTELDRYFKHIKEEHPYEYNQCKRCVHGTNYGLTEYGMVAQFPKEFPNLAAARAVREIYFGVAPKLPTWHSEIRDFAAKNSYLGGKVPPSGEYHGEAGFHPFGYRHWFFNVLKYDRVKGVAPKHAQVARIAGTNYIVNLGEDAKRCVAFFPQSTAAGVIKEAMLRLFTPGMPNYIGDCYYGRSPLRAQVHDSLLLEVPVAMVEYVMTRLVAEMTRPIKQQPLPQDWNMGSHLQLGVEVKVGKNWAPFEKDAPEWNPGGMKTFKVDYELANDRLIPLDEYDEDYEQLTDEELQVPAAV